MAIRREAALNPEYAVGQRVMTIDQLPGRVLFAAASFSPGLTEYEVQLDGGLGHGTYTASQLRPLPADYRAGQRGSNLPAGLTARFMTENEARQAWFSSPEAKAGVSAEEVLRAQANEIHTADLDYPEMGTILDDRPDPGKLIRVMSGLRKTASSHGYDGPDDDRDEDYNGGELNDAGVYWAEPGQQRWMHDNIGPQEEAPPPLLDSPVLARLAQIEEASQFFGTPRQEAVPADRHAIRHATTINGTQIDDHGDAPGHGSVPRASDPNGYDERSTEGDGDPKWSDAPPEEKRANNGATVGMYPEGMSAGDGPALPVGAYVAALRIGADTGPMAIEALTDHLMGAHGFNHHDIAMATAGHTHDWLPHRDALADAHLLDHSNEGFRHWEDHPHEALTEGRRADGGPLNPRPSQTETMLAHSLRSRWEEANPREDASLLPRRDQVPEGAATYHADPDRPIDPVFGSQHVPWTGQERTELHSWDNGGSAAWGDFVNRREFTNRTPVDESVPGSAEEQLQAEGALAPDPDEEAHWRAHLIREHGWGESNARRSESRGQRFGDMHSTLHQMGMADHEHRDPREVARERSLTNMFGPDAMGSPGKDKPAGWQLAYPQNGGMTRDDLMPRLITSVPARGPVHPDVYEERDPARFRRMMSALDARNALLSQLEDDYPPQATEWIRHARVTGPHLVPLSAIDLDDRHTWSAYKQPAKVAGFGDTLEKKQANGKHLKPALVVATPHRNFIGDGHHRFLTSLLAAADGAGPPGVWAFTAEVDQASGPWDEMHGQQIREKSKDSTGTEVGPDAPPEEVSGFQDQVESAIGTLGLGSSHDRDDDSLDAAPPSSPRAWPMAGAATTEGGPAMTQGRNNGRKKRSMAPLPGAGANDPGAGIACKPRVPGRPGQPGKQAHLDAFIAAAGSAAFRFEFTAAWRDVVAKATRIRKEGRVRITHASAGMVIGAVSGDHDVYETGIQRPPHKPQTIQYWSCGCPWASFHQDKSLGTRYAGRPCSHVMALQFEAQARSMFGRTIERDPGIPDHEVVVKSLPPWTPSGWAQTWLAPSASLRTAGYAVSAGLTPFDQLQPHEQASVAQYHQQMIEEGNAQPGSTPHDYFYDSRQEPKADFLGRYMDADDEFKREYGPGDWEAHHQDTMARHPIPSYPEAGRWPLIVRDENPNYVDDGYHRMHSYIRDGATHIPTIRMYRTATPDEARDWDLSPEEREERWPHLAVHDESYYWQLSPEDRGPAEERDEEEDDQEDDPDCYYRHAGPCPRPGNIVRTAESIRHSRPHDFYSEIRPNPDFRPGLRFGVPEELSSHVLIGYRGPREAGRLHFSRSDDGQAYEVHMLHTWRGDSGGRNDQHKGVGSAMMDDFYGHVKQHGRWIDHGFRTEAGNNWWASYREPHPELNTHHAHPDEGWKDYWPPVRVAFDAAENFSNSGGRGAHTPIRYNPKNYKFDDRDEIWTQARGITPAQQATAALIAAGEERAGIIALALLAGVVIEAEVSPSRRMMARHLQTAHGSRPETIARWDEQPGDLEKMHDRMHQARAAMVLPHQHDEQGGTGGPLHAVESVVQHEAIRFTADQTNAPWGSENVSKRPPGKPYGATQPPDKDMDPGSYGPLAGPDPDNWGSIQDDSAYQMPLTNTATYRAFEPDEFIHPADDETRSPENASELWDFDLGHRVTHPDDHEENGPGWLNHTLSTLPPHLAYPDLHNWENENQDSFGYSDRSNTAGPATSIDPGDPQGLSVDAELHDNPEPALPSTTGDDIEATAAADGTPPLGHEEHGATKTVWLTEGSEPRCNACGHRVTDPETGHIPQQTRNMGPSQWIREIPSRELAKRATPMGDLARETFPQAQQPSPVGQNPGMGSMDELLTSDDQSIQTIGNQQWSGGGSDSDEVTVEPGQPEGGIDSIVAQFQRSAAARQFADGGGSGAASPSDGDIAAMARQYLTKTADVLPDKEAAELINEGRGQRARNLGLLRLEGTHYEGEDDDLTRRGISLDDYDDDVISV